MIRELLIALALAVPICFIVLTCVDVANAYETKTLEDVIDGGHNMKRYYDNETGVVCYWNERHPAYINCVQVRPIGRNEIRSLKDGD